MNTPSQTTYKLEEIIDKAHTPYDYSSRKLIRQACLEWAAVENTTCNENWIAKLFEIGVQFDPAQAAWIKVDYKQKFDDLQQQLTTANQRADEAEKENIALKGHLIVKYGHELEKQRDSLKLQLSQAVKLAEELGERVPKTQCSYQSMAEYEASQQALAKLAEFKKGLK